MIKDSGERTQFDTGAVRDMHTGKGRMDYCRGKPWWRFPSTVRKGR